MRVDPDDDPRPDPPAGQDHPDRPGDEDEPAPVTPAAADPAAAEPPLRPYWGEEPTAPEPQPAALRSPRPRLRAAKIAVGVASVLSLLDALASGWIWDETRRAIATEPRGADARIDALEGTGTSVDALNTAIDVDFAVLLTSGAAFIAAFVLVIRWQNVALRNVPAFGVRARYSPQRAGWAWFVPIWSLFGPKRAYDDLWRAAERDGATPTGREHWVRRSVPGLFGVWWGFWLLGFAVVLVGPFDSTDLTLGQQRTEALAETLSSLTTVVAGALFVMVMERITARHDERLAEAQDAAEA